MSGASPAEAKAASESLGSFLAESSRFYSALLQVSHRPRRARVSTLCVVCVLCVCVCVCCVCVCVHVCVVRVCSRTMYATCVVAG
jgi:hypothetical protein